MSNIYAGLLVNAVCFATYCFGASLILDSVATLYIAYKKVSYHRYDSADFIADGDKEFADDQAIFKER